MDLKVLPSEFVEFCAARGHDVEDLDEPTSRALVKLFQEERQLIVANAVFKQPPEH